MLKIDLLTDYQLLPDGRQQSPLRPKGSFKDMEQWRMSSITCPHGATTCYPQHHINISTSACTVLPFSKAFLELYGILRIFGWEGEIILSSGCGAFLLVLCT